MEIVGVVLSIISICISVIIAIVEAVNAYRINKINIEAEYFDELYKKILIEKLPLARRKIIIAQDGLLTGIDEFNNVLNDIRISSTYYAYADKEFYDELKKALEETENFLINSSNKKISSEDQLDFLKDLNDKITEVYNIMQKKCSGINSNNFKKTKLIIQEFKSLCRALKS